MKLKSFLISAAVALTMLLAPVSVHASDTIFAKDGDKQITYQSMVNELDSQTNCCMASYLKTKYGVRDQKHAAFKYQVCNAKVVDAYASRNDKYFVSNIPNVDKWGKFYFGLKQDAQASLLVNALGWTESGYNPKIVSPDGGYGIFQITPSAIGDKSIKKSMLLQSEYNTQYGIHHLQGFYQNAEKKYGEHSEGNKDFIWYLTLRGYNGGFKYIDRLFENEDDPIMYVFSGNFIDASKKSGRFVCFEKVNQVYPLKIYKTSETLKSKVF